MISLRDYQLRAIAGARDHIAAGKQAVCLVSPTGSGKTVIGAEIARAHTALGGRVLWICHRRELATQAKAKLLAFGVECPVRTIQSLTVRGDRPEATLVVLDEAHHYSSCPNPNKEAEREVLGAEAWTAVANTYEDAIKIGLTATPERSDGIGLSEMFDSLVIVAQVSELIAAGHLVPCEITRPEKLLKFRDIAQSPLDGWEAAGTPKTVVFCPSVRTAEGVLDEFIAAGVAAQIVTGASPKEERAKALSEFDSGVLRVLVNVYVLTEGWDCPSCECIILARGCSTPGTYLQIVGRALRPYPGKESAHLIDLKGVSHLHGAPDLDRTYSLTGKGIREKDADEQSYCIVCQKPVGKPGLCERCAELCQPAPDVLNVTDDPMVKYAAKRAEKDADRAFSLARWIMNGRNRGHKPGASLYKYRHVYGDWPPLAIKRAAIDLCRSALGTGIPRSLFGDAHDD